MAGAAVLAAFGSPPVQVTVHEGTSMSVAASPDGRALAVDLQGSIWTLSATGGQATRITDVFNDARQPSWSPDGKWIAFQGFRDGVYHIWAVAPDASGQHALTSGPHDDREPAWSHDGSRVAFSSDRGDARSYGIWVLETKTGALTRVTDGAADSFMPSWSPDDAELAFISTRGGGQSVWAVKLAGGAERRITEGVRADAPSWGPRGEIVYHATDSASSRYESAGRRLTGSENVFAFRAAWSAPGEITYVSDGKIRARSLTGSVARTIEFSATLQVTPARYRRRTRDFDSRVPRRVLGIVHPAISPDGATVAFSALGDIYLMPVGGSPKNITKSRFFDTDPAWSPDGSQLAYASDRGGDLLDLWIHDLRTGGERRLTKLPTSAMSPAWSPDGRRIAFLDVDGIWRRANVSVVDVATGQVTRIHESLFGPGVPTWSPDGKRVAIAMLQPYSARFREGTNQILSMSSTGDPAGDAWFSPVPQLSIDSRVGAGPAWSPDGTKMAVIYAGLLVVVPVSPAGAPVGPPRTISTEMAHEPSWTADSKHVLYQSMDKLRLVDTETGLVRDVPVNLTYTPGIPTGRLLVHAGLLVDGKRARARPDMDVLVVDNRIRSVQPHRDALHQGVRVVDASGLTVMPGLIEFHSHLQPDFGEAHFRSWLAWGVTTVRSPGGTPYEAAEDRETSDAALRPGPRVYATGYLMEWQRTYYKMAVAVSTPAHLEMELQRARILEHDLIKSYVRMPDLQQRRIVEFAHGIGIPAASHEVYPAALSGIDGTEHTTGTSRRGYSPKLGTLQRNYADVTELFAGSRMTLTPTLALGGVTTRLMIANDPALRTDARFTLYPPWLSAMATGAPPPAGSPVPVAPPGGTAVQLSGSVVPGSQMLMDIFRKGARIVAGTDTPSAANLHAELMAYVAAGMTPFEALQTATVNPAESLRLDAGSVEAGKLADLVIVEGNPLESISATQRVRRVIANGRLYDMEALIKGTAP